MPSSPTISVVVPVYNVTRYVAQALDSLFVQTFQDFEVVVVNDGCPDTKALEVALEPFRGRIHYFRDAHGGVAKARNTAVRLARGEFIVNLDPDDWFEPECLESQLAAIRAADGIAAVYGNPRFVGNTPLAGTCMMDRYPSESPVTFAGILDGRCGTSNPGSILRRSAIVAAGMYDESLQSWEDVDLLLRILKSPHESRRVTFNTRPMVNYRQHATSLTKKTDHMGYFVKALDKLQATLALTPEEQAALQKRRRAANFDVELSLSKSCLTAGDWSGALSHLRYCASENSSLKLQLALLAVGTAPSLLSAAYQLRSRLTS